jgi:hypothetical protein
MQWETNEERKRKRCMIKKIAERMLLWRHYIQATTRTHKHDFFTQRIGKGKNEKNKITIIKWSSWDASFAFYVMFRFHVFKFLAPFIYSLTRFLNLIVEGIYYDEFFISLSNDHQHIILLTNNNKMELYDRSSTHTNNA